MVKALWYGTRIVLLELLCLTYKYINITIDILEGYGLLSWNGCTNDSIMNLQMLALPDTLLSVHLLVD